MVHSLSGSVLLGFGYAYDGQGNRVSKTREDGSSEVYSYDPSMRLTQVDYGTAKTVTYTLDNLGNRTNEVQTVRPASGPNVVTQWSATFDAFNALKTRNRSGGGLPAQNVTYAYDSNGNEVSETTASPAAVIGLSWDRDNRLRLVTPPSPALPTSYAYDANGLRIQRVDSTGTMNYLLDGASVLEELDLGGSTVRRYMTNPQQIDEIISFSQSGVAYWPLTDALGSIAGISDSTGSVIQTSSYEVYGARTTTGSGPSIAFGFTGREHDADGLIYQRTRYREPAANSWLQPDRLSLRSILSNEHTLGQRMGLSPVVSQGLLAQPSAMNAYWAVGLSQAADPAGELPPPLWFVVAVPVVAALAYAAMTYNDEVDLTCFMIRLLVATALIGTGASQLATALSLVSWFYGITAEQFAADTMLQSIAQSFGVGTPAGRAFGVALNTLNGVWAAIILLAGFGLLMMTVGTIEIIAEDKVCKQGCSQSSSGL
jgi:RHS repeat-associated protein